MDEAEKLVIRASVKLQLNHPFYAILLLGLEQQWDSPLVSNCAVDGRTIFYDRDWFKTLTVNRAMGVMAHESSHLGLMHIPLEGNHDHQLWVTACNHVINLMLEKDGFELPDPKQCDIRFNGMTEEQVYRVLKSEKEDKRCGSSGQGQGVKQGSGQKEQEQGKKQGQKQDPEQEQQDKSQNQEGAQESEDATEDASEGTREDTGEGTDEDTGNFDTHSLWSKLTDIQKQELARTNQETLVKALTIAKQAGKMPGSWASIIENMLRPIINGQEQLSKFMVQSVHSKANYRLFPPNKKHLWRGMILPSIYGEHIEVAVGVDTSGSISDQELALFNSWLSGICHLFNSYRVHYYQCDARIQDERIVENGDEFPSEMKGRGGTSYRPIFQKVLEVLEWSEVSCLVCLTDGWPNDGWPDAGELPIPVMWVMSTDVVPPFGEHVKLVMPKGVNEYK